MSAPSISRNQIVQVWGTPNATVGSVNEPREQQEHGHRFNEKWIYRIVAANAEETSERVIYWLRYDFVASCVVSKNGNVREEDLTAIVGGARDRRYHAPAR
jgi:hypothetical protein